MGANLSVHIDHRLLCSPQVCLMFLLNVKVEENTHRSFAQPSRVSGEGVVGAR